MKCYRYSIPECDRDQFDCPCPMILCYDDGQADMLNEVIKKLAEDEDTILSDKQYYALMELKEQKNV